MPDGTNDLDLDAERRAWEERYENAKLEGNFRAASELLFVLLPFLVIAMTLAHRRELRTMFYMPEWSIVSAVLAGQTIVKIGTAMVLRASKNLEVVGFILAFLIVCILVPILIVLVIILTTDRVTNSLAIAQAILFLISVGVFTRSWWIEAVSEFGHDERQKKLSTPQQ
jgi:hypothetical protein